MGGTSIDNSRNTINFNITINNTVINTGGAESVNRTLNLFDSVNDRLDFDGGRYSSGNLPTSGSVPEPGLAQAGAPAGRGLAQNPEGWPDGTVETAGGYRVVPEGNHNWSVFAPDQNPGDTAHTRVHGDPHVTEKDGTKWDFTKDSDFVLPDGTRIFADTDYDNARGNGQSLTKRLVITNGEDRIEMDNLAGRQGEQTSTLSHDAYEWRALHLTNPDANNSSKYGQEDDQHDAFHLRGDNDTVQWARERDGRIDGVVTGDRHGATRTMDGNVSIYDQEVTAVRDVNTGEVTRNPTAARELRPPIGTRAWGNQLRGQLNDATAKLNREYFGQDIGALFALNDAYGIHADHIQGDFNANVLDWMAGGWPGYWDNFQGGYLGPFNALQDMVHLLRSDSDWRNQFRYGQYELTQWT